MRAPINHKSIISVNLFALFFLISVDKIKAQNTSYTPLYTSSNFVKTIDLSKPVGIINGAAGATPTGGVTYSIPVYTSPGTNGLQPSVSITYNSQVNNGMAGWGWNLGGLSVISRTGKNIYHNGIVSPVTYTSDDAFLLDGMRLNAITGSNGANGTIYAGEIETFAKIISYTTGSVNNPDWFQTTAKDGSVMEFGHSADSRMSTDNSQSVMLWRLNKIIDINGNYIEFKYNNTDRDSHIEQIIYTGNANTGSLPYNQINFSYTVRSDINTGYDAGASLSSKYLLDKITIINTPDAGGNQTVKTYKFNYGFDNVHSFLKEVIEYGGDETGPSLNSTIFLYGDPPPNITSELSSTITGNYDIFPGDFDADGKSDLLAATFSYINGIKRHTAYTIFSNIAGGNPTTLYSTPLTGQDIIGGYTNKLYNFFTSDYNKDGRDDVIYMAADLVESGQTFLINKIILNKTGSSGFTTRYIDYPVSGGNYYQLTSSSGQSFIPGDFDGDGNQDYILIARDGLNRYKAFITSPGTNELNIEIGNFGVGTNPYPNSYAQTVLEADKIVPIDFDGDGKMELLVIKNNQSFVLSLNRVSITTGYYFIASVLTSNFTITKNCRLFPGDFNGDKKTDLLMHYDNNTWGILYSNGISLDAVAYAFSFQQTVAVNGYDITDKIVVADFNGDGKSDILHGYNYYVGGVATTSKLSFYYSRGPSSPTPFYYEQYTHDRVMPIVDLISADFNGDGRNDLIGRFASDADFIYVKPFGTELLLSKITNGHNSTSAFEYKLLTDKSVIPYVYDRTVSLDDPANQNPYNYVQLPLYAVSAISVPDGIGGNNTTTFNYENAIVHRAAKGFLGFRKITAKDAASGITSIAENDINTQFAAPYVTRQTTYLTSTNQLLSESQITNSFTNLSTGFSDIRYLQKVDKILNIDYLNGKASESVNTYDSYDNITTNVTKTGILSGNTVDPTETTTTTTAYSVHNTPVPAKPDNVTISNLRTGMSTVSATTSYTYTINGLPTSQTIFDGLPKAISTTYTYNSFGNSLTAVTSSAGLNSRTTTNTYDAKGRFVLSKQASGNNVSQTTSTAYDSKWGSPISTTSPDCLTTTFVYDEFGRLKTTNLPEGYSVNTTLNWDIQRNSNNVYYSFTDYQGGHQDYKTWYDELGRETIRKYAGIKSIDWVSKITTYNAQGNIATQTNNYYTAETPLITTNSYDVYGRVLSQTNALGATQYSYIVLSGGKLQITVTNAAGQSSSQITDPAGRVIIANDNGGQLDFIYDSRGNQLEVKHANTTLVTSVYDVYGRQTNLTDINAGPTSYTYNAYGQLTQQVDAKGNTYNILYDDLGRITSKTLVGEAPTTYEYYKDIATGCNNNSLSKITGPNGVIKEYTFDALKRPATEKVTVDGTNYITSYLYDPYGNLYKTTYPSGEEIVNSYELNGYLTKIVNGNTILFLTGDLNGSGQYTSYDLGNGISTVKSYYFGIPTRFRTFGSTIQDLNFTFDYTTGNLLSRYDAAKNKTENFEYDNLNRLIRNYAQIFPHPLAQTVVNYDNNSGVSKGNIANKTDGGYYTYSNSKLHAVAYTMDQPPPGQSAVSPDPVSVVSHNEQLITYTPFLKTASITEGIYQLNFAYGPDYQRVKTELKTNGVVTETRYYFGNYEKQIKNGITREIHYVSDGNELIAILVKENGVTTPYYVYTDHLGSILTVSDASGNGVADQNFDAWGRRRDPRNWNTIYAPTATPTGPDWLYRGFTGHEMLPQFALINMNGRMYDPVLGRMLSPDNYVTGAFNTQGYNRYSYAMNNPLSYVDQDGNFPWLAVAIVATLSGTAKGLDYVKNKKDFFDGFWRGAAVGGVGAAIGVGLTGCFANLGMVGSGFLQGGISGFISGGIGSVLAGDNFFDGALAGLLSGGLSGAAFGALNRAAMGNINEIVDYGEGAPNSDYFESQEELEGFINKNVGDLNSIEKEVSTDIQLANAQNLPEGYIYGPVGHRIYKPGGTGVFTVDGVTQLKGGWFSKAQSTIFISPHVKGVYFNGGDFGQMVINHEIMHAYHWAWSWGNATAQQTYSERATSMYSLAYAKVYNMPLYQSYYRPKVSYYPDWYSWRKNPWFAQHLKLGVQ